VAEPFKNYLHLDGVLRLSHLLLQADKSFDSKTFLSIAYKDFESLELKARAVRITDALAAVFSNDFYRNADLLETVLAPVSESQEPMKVESMPAGIAGWMIWPLTLFISQALGQNHLL